jgi:hypothetical protein
VFKSEQTAAYSKSILNGNGVAPKVLCPNQTWETRFDMAKRFDKDADPPDGMGINPKSSFKSDRSLQNRFGVPSSFRFIELADLVLGLSKP